MNEEEVKLLRLETGLLWPHYKDKKALSASTLTKFLREEEFREIPKYILLAAAERGKVFHKTVQDFIRTGKHPPFVDLAVVDKLSKLEQKIHETVNFLKKNDSLELNGFLGIEKLHYAFYKGELLATYLDLEFQDCIIELKTSNIKANKSPLALLIFEIQLLIQYLCTGKKKNIYLLWSTGQGVILNRFQVSDYSLKILDVLIEFARNNDSYSPAIKKAIILEILNKYYSPKKLIILN